MTKMNPELEPVKNTSPRSDAAPATSLTIFFTLIFGLLALLPIAIFVYFQRPSNPNASLQTNQTSMAKLKLPQVSFVNITAEAGLNFVHTNAATGQKWLPETMGSGCAFVDYDNDGHQDIVLLNSTRWPWEKSSTTSSVRIYHNDGKGHFTETTASLGLNISCYAMGVASGDYDNDGFPDLVVTSVGVTYLLHNEGGKAFRDSTVGSGLASPNNAWGTSCAFLDFDNDGLLDLFICHYVQWSQEIDGKVDYNLPGIGRAYGQPMNFPGAHPQLFRNSGQGHFVDVSAHAGIQINNRATGMPLAKSLGVSVLDLDDDGWLDLIVANDTVQNFVFHNERNGTFREVGAMAGLAFDNFGRPRGAMGIDSCRIQNDSTLGISIGNFANEMTALYVQRGSMLFSDEALSQGIGASTREVLTFGVFFFDYDLDGWLDLLTVNGHIEPEIGKVSPSQTYKQAAQLFWNERGINRAGGFVSVPSSICGEDLLRPSVARGSAFADIDGDGDLDVLITELNGSARLFQNRGSKTNHYVRLKLVGQKSNRDAIGARIELRLGSQNVIRHVLPTRGYLSQSELPVSIGLGTSQEPPNVLVIWPSGIKQTIGKVPIDRITEVVEPH